MEYQKSIVENILRNYYALKEHHDPEFANMYVDVAEGMRILRKKNLTFYDTLVNVFILGNTIVLEAERENATTRQISYRLDIALDMLTDIMNGVIDED